MMRCDGCGTVIERGVCPYCGMRQDSPGEAGYVPEILGQLMTVAEAHTESELAEIIKNGSLKDNEIFTRLLRRAVEVAPGEVRDLFSDDFYDATALMRAGKYNEALRMLRAIEDYHSDAPDMAGECLRHLANDIVRKLKPSMTHESRNIELDPEIDALREECRVMIERYIEVMYTRSQSTPAEEYIFAMNASQLVKCVDRLNVEPILTGVKRLRLLNDTRAILRKTGEFLERNTPITQDEPLSTTNDNTAPMHDALPIVNDNAHATTYDESCPAMNEHITTQNSSQAINYNNTATIPAINDSHTPIQDDSALTQNDSTSAINDNNTLKQDDSIPAINECTTIQNDSLTAKNDYTDTAQDDSFPTMNDSTATATQEPFQVTNDNATTNEDSLTDIYDTAQTKDDSFPAINDNNATTHDEQLPAVNDNNTTQDEPLPDVNERTTTQDPIPATDDNTALTTHDDSLPTPSDSQPDNHKIPTWLKIALITVAIIALALTLPQILSLIASLL